MFNILVCVLLLSYSTQIVEMATGFDVSSAVTRAQFVKFKASGNSFFIARIHRSVGQPDSTGITNIKTAYDAGFSDVDGYIFPCTSTNCPTATTQMTNTINALKAAKVVVGTIWLDVENPPAWPSDVAKNRKFVEDMANTAIKAGYKIGIYTGAYAWNTICGSTYTSYSGYPLWWANYNKKADLTSGWKNFGGWTKATIHQYDQNHSENGITFDPNVK